MGRGEEVDKRREGSKEKGRKEGWEGAGEKGRKGSGEKSGKKWREMVKVKGGKEERKKGNADTLLKTENE